MLRAACSTNRASSAAARLASLRAGISCAPACPPSPAQQAREGTLERDFAGSGRPALVRVLFKAGRIL